MRIAYFSDSYPPMRDGVAHVASDLARTVAAQGHEVRVYAPRPGPSDRVPREEVSDGVTVRRLASLPVPLYGQYRWPVFPFRVVREAARDAEVVHLHTPGLLGTSGFLAARHARRPLVGTFHTNLDAMRASVPRKLLVPLFFRVAWWYNLGTYYRCTVTTAPSEAARATLLASSSKPFRRPVEVVPNGIDLDRFRPGAAVPDWRSRCGLGGGPLVTFLGRLTVDKGVLRFLDGFARAAEETDVVGIVGGSGPEEAAVRARIASDPRLAARLRYVGPVAEEEKAALLGQSDLFVLPSTSDTSSVALLEAMACGAAVVAPSEGGASEVVQDGRTGRVGNARSADDLGRLLVELAGAPAERARLGRAAAAWVRENRSLEAMARRFISLYRSVLEEQGQRGHGLVG
ncbi:MAG TPA: glycosyltransferase [Thermoplasmata archaeon]|nr:glycosyltransferase [Thermoplasmata archaeon]